MELTVSTFFSNYIVNPLSKDLHWEEKILATALSVLLAPFLGIAHLVGFFKRRKIKYCFANQVPLNHDHFQKILRRSHEVGLRALKMQTPARSKLPITQERVSTFIQNALISPYYAKSLPSASKVTVPIDNANWVKWKSLSANQKIKLYNKKALAHNKIANTLFNRLTIDLRFYASGIFGDYLKNDPRRAHGVDHCSRVGIYGAVFAYLYHKYHPSYQATKEDIIATELIGAGHDVARQSEGVDFYDKESAKVTVEALEKWGVTDRAFLEDAFQAIADKDNKNMGKKSLIAKCVHDADSQDYARLWTVSPTQKKSNFAHSRSFLDIYKEIKALTRGQKDFSLKNGLTYQDFLDELDAARREMLMFTWKTKKRSFRESLKGKNVYDQMTKEITRAEYPLLSHILQNVEVLKPKALLNDKKQCALMLYQEFKRQPIKYVTDFALQQVKTAISFFQDDAECFKIFCEVDQEFALRGCLLQSFQGRLTIAQNDPKQSTMQNLCKAYQKLQPVQRDAYRVQFLQIIDGNHPQSLISIQAESEHEKLKTQLNQERDAKELLVSSLNFLKTYEKVTDSFRDVRQLTTAALGFEKACRLFLKSGKKKQAKKALELAATKIPIDQEIMNFQDLENVDRPIFFQRGCHSLRFRRLRGAKKNIDGKKLLEVNFELTSDARKAIDAKLALLKEDPNVRITSITSCHPKKTGGKYNSRQGMKIAFLGFGGRDKKVHFKDLGIDILIGTSKFMYNHYHSVRVRMQEGTRAKECHQALSRIGLPTALMRSRPEDLRNEGLGRILCLRHPKKIYSYQKRHGKKNYRGVYDLLSDNEKGQIDDDLKHMKEKNVGIDQTELVYPKLGEIAKKEKAKAIGFAVQAGDIWDTSKVIVQILKNGLLSSQERHQRGILSLGNVPLVNYWQGSANQVFTRTLTESVFKKRLPLASFSLKGPVTILLDVSAYERMPYTYLSDKSGTRNPYFFTPFFTPFPQRPRWWFKGEKEIRNRPSFPESIRKIEKSGTALSETMFDHSLGPQYIRKLLVENRCDKYILIKELEKNGIGTINGVPLDTAIVVTKTLRPDLIE